MNNNVKSKETLENEKAIREARAKKWEAIDLIPGKGKIIISAVKILPERLLNGVALPNPGSEVSHYLIHRAQGTIVAENNELQAEYSHKVGDYIYFKPQPASAKIKHKGEEFLFLYVGDIICKVQ